MCKLQCVCVCVYGNEGFLVVCVQLCDTEEYDTVLWIHTKFCVSSDVSLRFFNNSQYKIRRSGNLNDRMHLAPVLTVDFTVYDGQQECTCACDL